MPCFKNTAGNYNFNDAVDREEDKSGRRDGIYTGTKLSHLTSLDSIQLSVKTEEDFINIKNALMNNAILKSILSLQHPQVLKTLIEAMYLKDVSDYESLFYERSEGNEMFISRNGIYNVIKDGKKIGIFSDQRVIGELALFYKSKRPFTIRAVGKGALWAIDRITFQTIIVRNSVDQETEMLSFLKKVPEVGKLSEEKLMKLALLFEKTNIAPDTVIIDEESEIKNFYMLNSGWAVATKDKIGKVKDFRRGDFFGEKSLVQKEIVNVTITAKDNGAEFLTMNRNTYQNYLKNNSDTTQNDSIHLPSLSIDNSVQNLKLTDFEKVETVGKGGFAKVDIVYHKDNKTQIFALKYINKADVVEAQQIESVFGEKDIQINLNCNFIVRLYKTFKDNKYLYFLLEPCMGGDLYTLLQKQRNKQFSEASVKFYAACVIEALDYLHNRSCVYRDLKPENLVIDANGYVKLADFSLSKHMVSSKTYTFAGTPAYTAPEIILNQGYDKAVDFWALGILIFELLTGRTPFAPDNANHLKTYENILDGIKNVDVPKHLSGDSVDVIRKLCVSMPCQRLDGKVRYHKFFNGFNWNSLKTGKLRAPHISQMTHPLDVRNFEICKDNYIPPDESGDWSKTF